MTGNNDLISREAVLDLYDRYRPSLATHVSEFGDELKALPSVTQKSMLPIMRKLVEDIKAKEMEYGINGLKVQISFSLTEAQILLDALLKAESEQ